MMDLVTLEIEKNGIAILALNSGKINAINEQLVDELTSSIKQLKDDPAVRALVLTGREKFFSFGFNIPEFMEYSRDSFTDFLIKFTGLYHELFNFPKPLVAAINGHCIAGGAILACACDYRIMVAGKNKIGLNELGFGSTVLAGAAELLNYCVGAKNSTKILFSGNLFSAGEAHMLGLVDKVTTSLDLKTDYLAAADGYADKEPAAFASIKKRLHQPVMDAILQRERHSIHEFVDIWYSEETRSRLAAIKVIQ